MFLGLLYLLFLLLCFLVLFYEFRILIFDSFTILLVTQEFHFHIFVAAQVISLIYYLIDEHFVSFNLKKEGQESQIFCLKELPIMDQNWQKTI